EDTDTRSESVRWTYDVVPHILTQHGEYKKSSQLVVARFCTNVVGVKGDAHAYGHFVGVRAVQTTDFMTAQGYQFPAEVRREITTALTKHPEFVHTAFFETDKPPATTE